MKKINKMLFLVALSVGVFTTSCSEDDHTGASMINYSSPTVTLSTASTNVVVDESAIAEDGELLIPVTASISEPVLADIHIPLVQTGGTADAHDFNLGTIIISSGTTSATTNIAIYNTCDTGVEGNETLTVSFADNIANANMTAFSMDISIENDWVNDALEIAVDWSGEYTYTAGVPAEVTIDFCDADLDVLLFDGVGNFVGYVAATAACPETGAIAGLPDGDYILGLDVYDNPFSGLLLNQPMPISVSYSQCGFDTSGSFVNDDITTDTASGIFILGYIEVSGGYNYTVTTP